MSLHLVVLKSLQLIRGEDWKIEEKLDAKQEQSGTCENKAEPMKANWILFLLLTASKPDKADDLQDVLIPFPIEKYVCSRKLKKPDRYPTAMRLIIDRGQWLVLEWSLGPGF